MILLGLTLKKYITKELLYFTWLALTIKQKKFFFYFETFFFYPLSQVWFSKTSNLLKNNCYNFSDKLILKKKSFFSKKVILALTKIKVLETAFSFLFVSHLLKTVFSKRINLTECLRLLINNLNPFFAFMYINKSLNFLLAVSSFI